MLEAGAAGECQEDDFDDIDAPSENEAGSEEAPDPQRRQKVMP